ncbi:FAD/NAD(P)-binding domain-containing protein [Cadophora sp. DSE1049]|nr:FAD/NAD(P)-binding domain-containing protein [Cadophora sp. DSE1049]
MPSKASFTILVIGGGVAGLAASIGLRRKGHKVIVLESTTTLQTLGGSLLIPPNAARVLSSYNLWEKFKEAETIPRGNTTFRYEDGRVLEEVDYGAMEGAFGFPVMAIPRAKYQKLLHDAAIGLGVQVRLSSRIKSLDENIPSVTLTTREVIRGDIIVGADGWYAPTRQMISGSDTSSSFYRMTLIFYPSTSSPLSSSDILAANSASSYRLGSTTSLRQLVSDFEPRVRKLAELVKPEDCFLWKIAHLPKLKSWVSGSGKVVLLGDAAHAMVPHLGAGAATAVEDGAILAECLSHTHFKTDIPQALKTYENLRRPRAERIQATALITGQYKVMPDGPAQQKRDEKMKQRMDRGNPKYEYWKAGGGLEWLYGYDFLKEARNALNESTPTVEQQGRNGHKL